jgi:molecular chaperone DnaK
MKKLTTFGIDFGTTNSAATALIGTNSFNVGEGHRPFPSVVAINKLTGRVVARGLDAWQKREELSDTCEVITSPKSYLGTNHVWKIGGQNWFPVDIAAEVFKGLVEKTESSSYGVISEATVSIPVGFSPSKRRELRQAAKKAGIHIAGFVSEPTAAVLKNYDKVKMWTRIAVLDWGGGTLDISVVELLGDTVRELAAVGIQLGGDNLDKKIAEWVHNNHIAKTKSEVPFHEIDKRSRDRLMAISEDVKRQFSTAKSVDIRLPSYGNIGNIITELSLEKMQSLLSPEIDQVLNALKKAVNIDAKMSFDELGCVLMVGGSSKLAGLYDKIEDLVSESCDVIAPSAQADWEVAQGAAMLGRKHGAYVNNDNIGIELCDGTFFPIISAGTDVEHTKSSLNFGIVEDTFSACFNFHKASINEPHALSGSSQRRVGTLLVPTNGFVNESIALEYSIDQDLYLKVSAKSDHKGNSSIKDWEYDQLLFTYSLPLGGQA